jgi:predicted nucleotidyltransferase
MKRNEVLTTLKSLEPALRAYGVDGLYLYGSFARDEADTHSDIDIFVDALHPTFYTLGPFVGAYEEIRKALPEREIGYGTRNGLSPHIRSIVEAEAVKVF